MRQKLNLAEKVFTPDVVLLPTDTLLCALGRMERHHTGLLPVVGEGGELLGLVSKDHILAAWEVNPLLSVSLVMVACEERGHLSAVR